MEYDLVVRSLVNTMLRCIAVPILSFSHMGEEFLVAQALLTFEHTFLGPCVIPMGDSKEARTSISISLESSRNVKFHNELLFD